MDNDYSRQLEAEIDRQLKALPELEAPGTLMARVRSAISERNRMPWYMQSWQLWPAALRYGALAFLLVAFGGLCVASWQLTRAAGYAEAMREVGDLFSGVVALWNALAAVVGALVAVIRHLNTTLLLAICFVCAIAYAICVGVGTMAYRFAFMQKS